MDVSLIFACAAMALSIIICDFFEHYYWRKNNKILERIEFLEEAIKQ